MDKLYYYVLQADRMIPKWLKGTEDHLKHLLSSNMWRATEFAGLLGSASERCDNGNSDDDSEYDTAVSNSLEADDDAEDTDGNSKG